MEEANAASGRPCTGAAAGVRGRGSAECAEEDSQGRRPYELTEVMPGVGLQMIYR